MAKPESTSTTPDILLIDNYDSFTWNIYQYLCELGANVTVVRSQEVPFSEISSKYNPTHLVISPGPGHPLHDSGISIEAVHHYAGKIPILGICMGLQCMCAAYGGVVDGAGEIIHGKTSKLEHDGKGLFKGLDQGIKATRYHSLAGSLEHQPDVLAVTCRTIADDADGQKGGIIMGMRHKVYAIEGVQYHPESILSVQGKDLLQNFLNLKSGIWAENPGYEDVCDPSSKPTPAPTKTPGLPTILNRITEQRRLDVQQAKNTPSVSPSELESRLSLNLAPPVVDLYKRLQASYHPSTSSSTSHVALMAEIKRASPSKGDIVPKDAPFSSAHVGLSYALAGASVISVLTEPKWFKGSLEDMRSVRETIAHLPYRPAVLRKDFILDTYQIDEARLNGADTVLLIVAMLDDETLHKLFWHSRKRGMEPLVEVNNAQELERALELGSKVIGVNNRNLHDFNVDMSTTSRLAEIIQEKKQSEEPVILCALSGISSRKDVVQYVEQGVGAVLVGESLMRAQDKVEFARQLLGSSANDPDTQTAPSLQSSSAMKKPLVKICGVKTPQAALTAAQNGADLIGLMFVKKSKRFVDIETAKKIVNQVRTETSTSQDEQKEEEVLDISKDWFQVQQNKLLSKQEQRPLFVGVFQDSPLDEVISIAQQVKLDMIQFHGNEPWEWSRQVGLPCIRAFAFPPSEDESQQSASATLVETASRPGYHVVPLFDTLIPASKSASANANGLSGGAGKPFDWSLATKLANKSRGEGLGTLSFMLAGGLDPSNVQEAIKSTGAFGVDVSGGVETDGEKDLEKIAAFIKAAKSVN